MKIIVCEPICTPFFNVAHYIVKLPLVRAVATNLLCHSGLAPDFVFVIAPDVPKICFFRTKAVARRKPGLAPSPSHVFPLCFGWEAIFEVRILLAAPITKRYRTMPRNALDWLHDTGTEF